MPRLSTAAAAALATALLLTLAPGLAGQAAAAPPTSLTFRPGAVNGGGFQNVVAVDPGSPARVATGGDVAGVSLSSDRGATFRPHRAGITTNAQLQTAALTFAPGSGTLYACTGIRGGGGGFLARPAGSPWQVRSTAPRCSGNGEPGVTGLPGFPRSTGNLIAVDPAAPGRPEAVYVGTYRDGLLRSTDGGRSWTTLGLAGQYIRGIAFDDTDRDRLFVAVYNRGVYVTDAARGAGSLRLLAGSPRTAEEIVVVSGVAYVASGPAGVHRYDGAWASARSGLPTGPVYISLAGARAGTGTVLYVGNQDPVGGASLYRSTDGGRSWSPAMTTSAVRNSVGGPGGPAWWLLGARRQYWPGAERFAAANVQLDPRDPRTVYVAGRSGLWRTTDAGATWYPMVAGLQVTVNMAVAADPRSAGRVHVGNMDYTLFSSRSDLQSMSVAKPGGSDSVGFAIGLDTTRAPATVALATGNRDLNRNGEVFTNPDPAGGGAWRAEGLRAAAGGNRPLGVALMHAGGSRVLLAAVEGADAQGGAAGKGGIWRKQDGGAWTRVLALPTQVHEGLPLANEPVPIVWPSPDGPVYAFERHTGVWRSRDTGRTWQRIWAVTSPAPDSGYLAAAPGDPGRLFVSLRGPERSGVFALSPAATGAPVGSGAGAMTATPLGALAQPSAITTGPEGRLWAVTMPSPGRPVFLGYWNGSSWVDLADDALRDSASNVNGLAVSAAGVVHVVYGGGGTMVGRPR